MAKRSRSLSLLTLLLAPGVASLHIVFGAHAIPHPEKVARGGEDAFFCDDLLGSFGIADGVGGSAREDVDPGAFSRETLSRCHQVAQFVPKLTDAVKWATECPIDLGGSTTLVLGQLEAETNTLRLLNLGDSGAMLLRPSRRETSASDRTMIDFPRCVLRSHDQIIGFNYPFQASKRNFGSVSEQLDEISTVVKDGDVVIAATDGVLDNLFDLEMQRCVTELLPFLTGEDPDAVQGAVNMLAQDIAVRANAIGLRKGDPDVKTPFMQAAAEEGKTFLGGKLDDVAIVCGVVRQGARPEMKLKHNFDGPEIFETTQQATAGVVVPTAPQPMGAPPKPMGAPPQQMGAPPVPMGAPPKPMGAPPQQMGAPPVSTSPAWASEAVVSSQELVGASEGVVVPTALQSYREAILMKSYEARQEVYGRDSYGSRLRTRRVGRYD